MRGKHPGRLLVALLCAALLPVRPALAAALEAPEGFCSPFPDVTQEGWYYPFVAWMSSRGFIRGYPDGRFGPEDTVTAGDAILMLVKAAGGGELAAPAGGHYAQGYVDHAVARGWLTAEETPALDGPMSRALTGRLAAGILGLAPSRESTPFGDVDDPTLTALYRSHIMEGVMGDGERVFEPEGSLTRAQLCTVAWRVGEYPTHISFEGRVLDVLAGVPVCFWDDGAFVSENGRMTYTGPEAVPAVGIDVSSHQGDIDWQAAAGDGVEFAVIRAGGRYYGSGKLFEDKYFRKNLAAAAAAGVETGVYFFSQAVTVQEAEEEAEFVLGLLAGRELAGPVVFDWENIDNDKARTDGVDPATVSAMANAFCRRVEGAGYRPMVYFNQIIAYLWYDLSALGDYPCWLAWYTPAPGYCYDYQMWQYSATGRVAGIQGDVDMDLRLVPW